MINHIRKNSFWYLAIILFIVAEYMKLQGKAYISQFGLKVAVIDIVLLAIILLVTVKLASKLIIRIYLRKRELYDPYNDNFTIGITRIRSILDFVIIFFSSLALFDVNYKELFTSLSIVAAAIALISKDYIANMINGMIIMFTNQLSIDDYVKIGEHKGKISNLTLMNTHLINDDDDLIYLPNTMVMNNDVINYTKREIKKTSIDLEVDYKYVDRVELMEEFLKNSLKKYHEYIKLDSYSLKVFKVNKDNVWLKFQFILQQPNKQLEKEVRRAVVRAHVDYIGSKIK